MGRESHIVIVSVSARVGAMRNRVTEDVMGLRGSLVNSFMASANSWSKLYGALSKLHTT